MIRATTTISLRTSNARPARWRWHGAGRDSDVFCAYEGCELVLESRAFTLKPFVTAWAPSKGDLVAQRRFHLLVVDDQPDARTMVVRALVEDQYTVSKATSGAEALRMIDEHIAADPRGAGLQR